MTDWKNPWTLDVLAAAYADRGNFAKAIYTEQEALALCKGTEYWVPRYRARLASVQGGDALPDEARDRAGRRARGRRAGPGRVRRGRIDRREGFVGCRRVGFRRGRGVSARGRRSGPWSGRRG